MSAWCNILGASAAAPVVCYVPAVRAVLAGDA